MVPSKCVGCIYERQRRIPVSQIKQADVVVVGEAPGKQEIIKQRPFVGESGNLLKRLLLDSGLPGQEECFVTNALQCLPPRDEQIKRSAIENCRARVVDEIKQVNPKIVITLGTPAIQSVTGNFNLKVTQRTGVPGKVPYLDALIMPTYHPAAAFRRPGLFHWMWSAFQYASHILKGGELKNPGKTHFEVIEPADVTSAIKQLRNYEVVGADIETAGFDYFHDRIIDFGIAYEKNKVMIFPEDTIKLLEPLFRGEYPQMSWCRGQFDTAYWEQLGFPARVDHDIIMLLYCLNEHEGDDDLDVLSQRILGAASYKGAIKPYVKKTDRGYEGVPKDKLWPYLALDCDHTYQIHDWAHPLVMQDPLLKKLYEDHLMVHVPFLREVQRNGLFVNEAHLDTLSDELGAEMQELRDEILDHFLPHWHAGDYVKDTGAKALPKAFNPGSPKQVAWMLFKRLGLKHRLRKKPDCTDKDVLMALEGQHPAIEIMLKLRKVSKMKTTYVDGIGKRMNIDDGKVHARFLPYGTVTGRLSSRNPNLQNIPRDSNIKSIFCAEPGHVLIEADYKGAELRVLAYLSNDKWLRSVFEAGRDLHDEVAKMFFGEDFTKDQRVKAKNINFGIAYGRTHYTLAREYNMSEIEAKAFLDEWFRRAPQAHAYLLECDRKARTGEVLTTPFGRKRRFGLIAERTVKDQQNEARNFAIQSIASDLTLISGGRIAKHHGIAVVNLVHDNVISQVLNSPESIKINVEAIVNTMLQVPKDVLNTDIPFPVDVAVGKVWGKLEDYEVA